MTRRDLLVLHGVAAAATLAVLGPMFAPGYTLSYDLVFVPHQPLTWDLVAPAGTLPRAVPQDAIVSLLSLALPGWLVERLALAAIVYGAVYGAGRLVPARRLGTRLVAAVGYAWTPFLAERLLLGQWGLLLGYAALPWLVGGALAMRSGQPYAWVRVLLAAAVCAITPTGGLIAVCVVAGLVLGRRPPTRDGWWSVAAVSVLNAPWLVAAAMGNAGARSDPDGVTAFAARGENWAGPFGAVLGTGGGWNAATMPASRSSALVPAVVLVLLGLAAVGFPVLRARWPRPVATRLAVIAAVALAIAIAGAVPVVSSAMSWAMTAVPGAGLLRDGTKFLAPYALVLVISAALGLERIAGWLTEPRGRLVLAAAVILPLAATPDLAWGGAGALRPVSYPADWNRVAGLIADDPEMVLALPFSEYRTYSWNRNRTVIDPAPRYLRAPVLADDTLIVGSIVVDGESKQAAAVRQLLARDEPVARTGARWVLVEHNPGETAVPAAVLAELKPIYQGQYLDLYANPAATPAQPSSGVRRAILLGGYIAAAGVLFAAVWYLRRSPTTW
jgi:hypothetical protein